MMSITITPALQEAKHLEGLSLLIGFGLLGLVFLFSLIVYFVAKKRNDTVTAFLYGVGTFFVASVIITALAAIHPMKTPREVIMEYINSDAVVVYIDGIKVDKEKVDFDRYIIEVSSFSEDGSELYIATTTK